MGKWILRVVGALVVLGILLRAGMWLASDPIPEGEGGEAADALARRIEKAVDLEAWKRTGAVSWTFGGRNQHLWDRQRGVHRVVSGERETWIHLGTRKGCAIDGGSALSGEDLEAALAKAYRAWVNDSFWMNPFGKLFDDGVTRTRVALPEGGHGLLATFGKNGVTPGDSYLWYLGEGDLPSEWRMWTVIPLGGARASWEGYQTLSTGARVATRHGMLGFELLIEDLAGHATLAGLLGEGSDPFANCAALGVAAPSSQPAP